LNRKEVNKSRAFGSLKNLLIISMEGIMVGSTYKIIELVGTSTESWENAAKRAVETAGETLKDLRIAEITKLDLTIENGKVASYRARVSLSFKYIKQ
jgi:dodecin